MTIHNFCTCILDMISVVIPQNHEYLSISCQFYMPRLMCKSRPVHNVRRIYHTRVMILGILGMVMMAYGHEVKLLCHVNSRFFMRLCKVPSHHTELGSKSSSGYIGDRFDFYVMQHQGSLFQIISGTLTE